MRCAEWVCSALAIACFVPDIVSAGRIAPGMGSEKELTREQRRRAIEALNRAFPADTTARTNVPAEVHEAFNALFSRFDPAHPRGDQLTDGTLTATLFAVRPARTHTLKNPRYRARGARPGPYLSGGEGAIVVDKIYMAIVNKPLEGPNGEKWEARYVYRVSRRNKYGVLLAPQLSSVGIRFEDGMAVDKELLSEISTQQSPTFRFRFRRT